MDRYIGVTIGPVVELLLSARKTRELWASSFLLSYLMKQMLLRIPAVYRKNILLPSVRELHVTQNNGAGLYPDRIYLEVSSDQLGNNSSNSVKEKVEKYADEVLSQLARDLHRRFEEMDGRPVGQELLKFSRPDSFTKENIEHFLKSYFKLYVVEVEFDPDKEKGLINKLSAACDVREQANKVMSIEQLLDEQGLNPLRSFLFMINHSFLYRQGFGGAKPEGFDSLIAIAARELSYLNPEKYQQAISESNEAEEETMVERFQKKFGEDFKDAHKYIAVIHADGDNVGQIISAIGDDADQIRNFSDKMLAFADRATDRIVAYGGSPVYSGGDDLMFFAPVAVHAGARQENVFDLISQIDQQFEQEIKKYFDPFIKTKWQLNKKEGQPKLPTMSYGISITYYKFPLYEARNLSYEMLEVSKKTSPDKNRIEVAFQKHSGQHIRLSIPKSRLVLGQGDEQQTVDLWATFLKVISSTNDNSAFLNSFTYKLDQLWSMLKFIASDPERLQSFFENNFNENYQHNQSFYKSLTEMILTLKNYQQFTNHEYSQKAFGFLYGTLRLIDFMHIEKPKSRKK